MFGKLNERLVQLELRMRGSNIHEKEMKGKV